MVTGSPERGGISGLFRGGEGGGAVGGGGLEGGGEGGGTETVVDPMFFVSGGATSRAWMLLFQTALNIVLSS